jgi:hypothetical protein
MRVIYESDKLDVRWWSHSDWDMYKMNGNLVINLGRLQVVWNRK